MARKLRSTRAGEPVDLEEALARRARRHARKGRYRKAAVALALLANRSQAARHYALLGAMWARAGRPVEAVTAFRQALFLHRRAGADERARTVARLIARFDPDRPLRAA